jgi:hypothetical protein
MFSHSHVNAAALQLRLSRRMSFGVPCRERCLCLMGVRMYYGAFFAVIVLLSATGRVADGACYYCCSMSGFCGCCTVVHRWCAPCP